MTKNQAYKKLELPVGTDLQVVRQKFNQMHNDFQVQIDGAFNEAMRKRKEQQLDELKIAYAILNESASVDDSASLPWTEKNFDAALPANQPLEQSNRQPDLEQSLALFGLTPNQDPDSIITRVQRHIEDFRVQSQTIKIPEAKILYDLEISKAERAKEVIAIWLNTIAEKQRLEEEHLHREAAERQRQEAIRRQEEKKLQREKEKLATERKQWEAEAKLREEQFHQAEHQKENPTVQTITSSEPKKGKPSRIRIYVVVGLSITIIGYVLFKRTADIAPVIIDHPADTSEVAFPDVEEKNFVEAVSILRNHSLLIGDTTYIDDVAKDWVLETRFRGQPVRSGSMVPKQSEIDLVLGNGKVFDHIAVPDLSGLNFDEAKFALLGLGLNIGSVYCTAELLHSPNAEVVNQSPKAGQSISLGAEINFTLAEGNNTPRIVPVLVTPVDELNKLAAEISFEFESSVLTRQSYSALDQISKHMRERRGNYNFIVHVYTGETEEYDMRLAKDQGNSLKTYLVNEGVEARLITVIAKGNSIYKWKTNRFLLEIKQK